MFESQIDPITLCLWVLIIVVINLPDDSGDWSTDKERISHPMLVVIDLSFGDDHPISVVIDLSISDQ